MVRVVRIDGFAVAADQSELAGRPRLTEHTTARSLHGATRLEGRHIREIGSVTVAQYFPECEDSDVPLRDIPVKTLSGQPSSLSDADLADKTLLVVNVASRCGLTPQYAGLEALHERFADRGFSVVGFPCNQFMGQEPGSPEEIAEFCSTTYGVTFPMFEKIDVNGDDRHPIYTELTAVADANGDAGDVQWNFEKFLVGPDGAVIGRFRPRTEPDAPALVAAIEASLAAS
jgi:glutathione peroxidase